MNQKNRSGSFVIWCFKKTVGCLSLIALLPLSACSENTSIVENKVDQNTVSKLNAEINENFVTTQTIMRASDTGWRTHGRTYSEQRNSPLDSINTQNISRLGLEWSFDFGDSRGIETTPIVHDGIMYVTATWNLVYALDAITGEEIWSFDPKIDKEQAARSCCDIVNRGVAIWGDSVFTGTMDGRLISLNAKTGKLNWDINTIDKSKPYTISGAPRVIDGKVIIGNGGAELGVRGYVTAYAADTGRKVWRFYTVPGDPRKGFENDAIKMASKTWTGEYWIAGAGGTVWDSMAYDPDLDLLYLGVGNGSPWNHSIRSPQGGDNLFLSSIVAIRPDSGEYVWHYQTTPADNWDYTATQHMILADIKIEGEQRKVIMQAPKNGFFYVLDRETGEFISANNYVPVTWATHIDPVTGRPVETESARSPSSTPILQLPGPLGGHNWQPMSFSPQTGFVYIPAQEAPGVYVKKDDYRYSEEGWNTGFDFRYLGLPSDKEMFNTVKATVKGRLIAWDPVKQEAAWSHEYQGPWNGGVLSTAGGLVFQGSADAHFSAYNAETGESLWKFFTQTGVMAAPVTYEIDQEQYIAVAAGWGGGYTLSTGGVLPTGSTPKIGRVMVFKLDSKGELPPIPESQIIQAKIPDLLEVDSSVIEMGFNGYANLCLTCHGDQAFSSGLVPNLRYSAITRSSIAWQSVLLDGVLAKRGMPNFGKVIDKKMAEAIRAYVIYEANSDRDKNFYESGKSE